MSPAKTFDLYRRLEGIISGKDYRARNVARAMQIGEVWRGVLSRETRKLSAY
jgi:hypothetical protein